MDPVATHGYALAADGKSYRTVRTYTRDKTGRVEVREVSTETGRMRETLVDVSGWRGELAADGQTLFATEEGGSVTAYDVRGGERKWTHGFGPKSGVRLVGPSADGGVVVVLRVGDLVTCLEGGTGRVLPELEGVDRAVISQVGPQNFSVGGHLLGLCFTPARERFPGPLSTAPHAITVWEPRTGRMVKSWPGTATVVFHPSRPVLALLEPNGEQTRLGLWDYFEQP